MLGRAREEQQLSRALDERASVLVVGPAGIGKTALVRRALRCRAHVQGAALAGLQWRPYLPLSCAAGRDLQGEPESVASEFLRVVGGRLLFVDDLQWADPGTHAVLGAIVGRVPLVVTSRRVADAPSWTDRLETIPLMPLSVRAARTLARRLHPGLEPAEVERLVGLAGGNPLLLQHLTRGGRISPTLRAAVAARLTELPSTARQVIAELALFGRPIGLCLLGFDAAQLPRELVAEHDGVVELRHQLLADAALASLDAAGRTRAHLRLAGRLPAADAAEHYLAAGEAEAAADCAREALQDLPDMVTRAHLLSVVASATGDDRWRVEAAEALVTVGDWSAAESQAAAVNASDPVLAARAALQRSRARWFAGDVAGAGRAGAEGLERLGGENEALAARLHVEIAHQRVRVNATSRSTTPIARDALAIAERAGVDVPRARLVFATALAHDGLPGCEEAFRAVIPEAVASGDHETECSAAFLLASHLGFAGRYHEAIELLETAIKRAAALGELTWRTHLECALVAGRFMAGYDPARVAAEAGVFVTEHPLFRNRAQAELALALSLGDLERFEEADAAVRAAMAEPRSAEDRSILLTAAAELAWMAGDLRTTSELATRAIELGAGWFGITAGAVLAAAHARFELGEPVDLEVEAPNVPIFVGFAVELEGLRCWSEGDAKSAIEHLDTAAVGWATTGPVRYAARARWAAGVVAARAGLPSARRRLEVARAEAAGACAGPIVRRVIDALVALGAAEVALTDREMAVLRLVGEGLTSPIIADRLAIGRSTVESHIAAAMRKLGANTRRQAASMVDRVAPG